MKNSGACGRCPCGRRSVGPNVVLVGHDVTGAKSIIDSMGHEVSGAGCSGARRLEPSYSPSPWQVHGS